MPQKPRNLRVLIIDDHPPTHLGTDFLELFEVPYGVGDSVPHLCEWEQHLELWRDASFPPYDPDLILIDCHFEKDPTRPLDDKDKDHPSLLQRDPRGLLHGVVYIARMIGRDHGFPFGFAIYSEAASDFATNAYAQTFVGFLLAMGHAKPDDLQNPREACEQTLKTTAGGSPGSAWGRALEMYRRRLSDLFHNPTSGYDIDVASFYAAKDLLSNAIKVLGSEPLSLEINLKWHVPGHLCDDDEVKLVSLFADKLVDDKWSKTAALAALEWLERLPDNHGVYEAVKWVKSVLSDERGASIPPRGKKNLWYTAAALAYWHQLRHKGKEILSSEFCESLDVKPVTPVKPGTLGQTELGRFLTPPIKLSILKFWGASQEKLTWGNLIDKFSNAWGCNSDWPLPTEPSELKELKSIIRNSLDPKYYPWRW